MRVDLLSPTHSENYGRYPNALTSEFIGTCYSDLTEIRYKTIEQIATQINVDDIQNCLNRYQKK